MAQQILLPSQGQTIGKQTAQKEPRPAPRSHRRPRTPGTGGRKTRSIIWGAAGLAVAFVLALLAGVLLAAHGPSESSAKGGPSVTLQPEPPTGAEPEPVTPAKPAKPAKPGRGDAESMKAEKITLRPGDTLWELARLHGTSVKVLQRLNDLGSSTLIYAGQTLDVPATPDSAGSTRQSKATQSSGAVPAAGGQPSATSTDKPAKPAKSAKAGKSTKRAQSAPNAVIAYAWAQVGKPYVWGGTGPGGFDCSGLVMRAWEAAGVKLPRTTWNQIDAGSATTRDRLVPGDLVLSYGGGHVGLYIGKGKVIHAPRPGTTVTVAALPDPGNITAYRHIHA
ncbi:NlpC/P60 family protein [Streptomyces bluensis]|uniref:C40 family peptidase n=1 Tax=Streptomyces bluensis TaxID=33897 RepID=UPI0033281516